MIVRILTEGQYRLSSAYLDQLNEIDNQLVEVVARGTDGEFERLFNQMLELVRQHGEEVPVEDLSPSDIILPDPSSSIEDMKQLFVGDGVVPN